jgi:hypothetical protein
LAVGHAGEGTGEEFERALACLFGSIHLSNVKNVEEAASEGKDEAVTDGVHEVDALRELVRGLLRGGCAGVPETDCAVPRASDDGI